MDWLIFENGAFGVRFLVHQWALLMIFLLCLMVVMLVCLLCRKKINYVDDVLCWIFVAYTVQNLYWFGMGPMYHPFDTWGAQKPRVTVFNVLQILFWLALETFFCIKNGRSIVFWLKVLDWFLIATIDSGWLLFVITVGTKYVAENLGLSPWVYRGSDFVCLDGSFVIILSMYVRRY